MKGISTTDATMMALHSNEIDLKEIDGVVYAVATCGKHEAKIPLPSHFFHLTQERQDFHADAICVELKKQLALNIRLGRMTIRAIKE